MKANKRLKKKIKQEKNYDLKRGTGVIESCGMLFAYARSTEDYYERFGELLSEHSPIIPYFPDNIIDRADYAWGSLFVHTLFSQLPLTKPKSRLFLQESLGERLSVWGVIIDVVANPRNKDINILVAQPTVMGNSFARIIDSHVWLRVSDVTSVTQDAREIQLGNMIFFSGVVHQYHKKGRYGDLRYGFSFKDIFIDTIGYPVLGFEKDSFHPTKVIGKYPRKEYKILEFLEQGGTWVREKTQLEQDVVDIYYSKDIVV